MQKPLQDVTAETVGACYVLHDSAGKGSRGARSQYHMLMYAGIAYCSVTWVALGLLWWQQLAFNQTPICFPLKGLPSGQEGTCGGPLEA